MNNTEAIFSIAKKTIQIEAEAINRLSGFINDEFAKCVNCMLNSKGRIIVSGIGKSALIASKIVATFNSTGTPAIFMHAADAIHGDLGSVQEDDIIICISKSGNTPEIKILVPLLKRGNNKLIGMTGNMDSFLAHQSDFVLNTNVKQEACPNNLAPTTSTTAQMVMGDALAICLLELKGFSSKDFAKYHPGGTLGKRLYLRVRDIVHKNQKPQVNPNTGIKEVIIEITEKMLGAAAVIENDEIVGVITDGDIRRMLKKYDDINTLTAKNIMSNTPKIIESKTLVIEALELMQENSISQLLVVKGNSYKGIIHLHNLINEGII